MTFLEFLKFGHVLGAITWVGAGIYGNAVALRLKRVPRRDRLVVINALNGAAALFSVAFVLVVGFGVWMVLYADAFSFGDTFVIIGIGGILLSGAVQGLLVAGNTKKLTAQLEADDPAADATMAKVLRGTMLDALILIVVVWAMVARPGG